MEKVLFGVILVIWYAELIATGTRNFSYSSDKRAFRESIFHCRACTASQAFVTSTRKREQNYFCS